LEGFFAKRNRDSGYRPYAIAQRPKKESNLLEKFKFNGNKTIIARFFVVAFSSCGGAFLDCEAAAGIAILECPKDWNSAV
jgi:hypothetical protein